MKEEEQLQWVLDSEGNILTKTKQRIINGYTCNIIKNYIYNPKSVQEGYDLLHKFAINHYLETK